jgi:hypothetical protein
MPLPECIPLGFDCRTALELRRAGARGAAFPLDWVLSHSVEGLCAALRERGAAMVDPAELRVENDGAAEGAAFTVRHARYGFVMFHEWWGSDDAEVTLGRAGDWLSDPAHAAVVRGKYARRWARLGAALAAGGAVVVRPCLHARDVPRLVAALHAAADGGRARGVTLLTYRASAASWTAREAAAAAAVDATLASWPPGGGAVDVDGVSVHALQRPWEARPFEEDAREL